MMFQRIAYGALAIAVTVALVLLDVVVAEWSTDLEGPFGDLLRRGSVIPIVVTVLILLGAVELNRLLRIKTARPHRRFAYFMTAVLVLTPWLSAAGWLGHGAAEVEGLHWPLVWIFTTFIGIGILTVVRGDTEGAIRDSAATLLIIIYLGFLGSFAVQLRCGRDIPSEDGAWLLLIAILVTRASDIGAYFAGSALGRHKLAPRISSGKTVEGAVGGLLTSAAVAALIVAVGSWAGGRLVTVKTGTFRADLYGLIDDLTRSFAIQQDPDGMSPLLRAIFFGLAMSATGQFGDLIESSFKRDAHVKDSGELIPRFGGILDLIDSPVVALPIAWFLLTAVWNVA